MMQILIIGFGEAGQAFATGWRQAGCKLGLRSYDLAFDEPGSTQEAAADHLGIARVAHDAGGFSGVDHVVSLVTADQAPVAARRAAEHLGPGQTFWDLNSVAPATKETAARAITATGARYVDVGVLSPVHPRLHRSSMVVAGRLDGPQQEALAAMGWQAEHLSDRIGDAAAFKLLRSVVIKGIESLLLECVEGGNRTGLTEPVLASLAASVPGIDWPERAEYTLERVANHGARRAAEMREATAFLEAIGVAPTMARATADRLERGVPV